MPKIYFFFCACLTNVFKLDITFLAVVSLIPLGLRDFLFLTFKKYAILIEEAYFNKFGKTGTYDLNASGVVFRNNQLEKVYTRVLIKHKNIAK